MAETKALHKFLSNRRAKDAKTATHNGVCRWGGIYSVSEEDRPKLCELIANCAMAGEPPSIVANTLAPDGHSEVKIDIDIKQPNDTGRQFTTEHEESLVDILREAIFENANIQDENTIDVYLSKREAPYTCDNNEGGKIEKDGIHLIVPSIRLTKETNMSIRRYIIDRLDERFLKVDDLREIVTLNDNTSVVDWNISSGKNGFFTLGSTKRLKGDIVVPPYEVLDLHRIGEDNSRVLESVPIDNRDDLAKAILEISHDSGSEEHAFTGKYTKCMLTPTQQPTKTNEGAEEIPDGVVSSVRNAIGAMSVEVSDDRDKWMKVCIHSKNISGTLKDDWVRFSKMSSKWKDSDVSEWDMARPSSDKWASVKAIFKIRDNDVSGANVKFEEGTAEQIIRSEGGLKPTQLAIAIKSLHGETNVCTNGKASGWWSCNEGLWEKDPGEANISMKVSRRGHGGLIDKLCEYRDSLPDMIGEKKNERKVQVLKVISGMSGGYTKGLVMRECRSGIMNDLSFVDSLDNNPNLIAMKNGVIDLRHGGMVRPITPSDRVTKEMCTNHALPNSEINTDNWTSDSPGVTRVFEILRQIQPDDNVRRFLLRLLGSCLRGGNENSVFPLFVGGGCNGKSALMDLTRAAMGKGLCTTTDVGLFTTKRADPGSANPCLARLGKCRITAMSEPEWGKRMNSGLVKELTGGESIATRDLHEKQREIKPQFTPIMCCNDLPQVRDQSDGWWRRVIVLNFPSKFVNRPIDPQEDDGYTFPMDTNLKSEFKTLAPHFLELLIRYFYIYEAEGLNPPQSVLDEVAEYRGDNDLMSDFVSDCIIQTPGSGRVGIEAVYDVFCDWYIKRNRGGRVPSQRYVKDKLPAALPGRKRKPYNKNRGFQGVTLVAPATVYHDLNGDVISDDV